MTELRNKNTTLLFFAGAVVGAAAAYYLTTPSGRRLTNKMAHSGKAAAEAVREKADIAIEEVKAASDKVIHTISDKVLEATEIAKSKSGALLDHTDKQMTSLQQGINKAKQKIQNSVESN